MHPNIYSSLDYVQTSLAGGTIWEKAGHDSKGMMTPNMYKIEFEGKPYLDAVKKFSVSGDCMIAALVTANNQILIYKVSLASPFFFVHCTHKIILLIFRSLSTTGKASSHL